MDLPNHTGYYFLQDGGEMGELTRSFDWSETSLGNPDQWPLSLRTTVSTLLSSRFPMFLWWGEELIQFYNDAYRPSLGNEGKHPSALGQQAKDCWPEIWDIIYPLIEQVYSTGKATWSEDQLVPIFRNGKIENVYWTFGYSPIRNDDGRIEGVLVICTETTEKVEAFRQQVREREKVEESEKRFRIMAEGTDVLIAVADETGNATYFNSAWVHLTGRPTEELLKFGWADLVHPEDRDGFVGVYLDALEKKEPFTREFRVRSYDGQYRWLLAQGPTRFHPDGSFAGHISSCIDITDRKNAEDAYKKSEQQMRSLVEGTPFPIGVYIGREMKVTLANDAILTIWGKGNDVIGKLFSDILPELDNQEVFKQLDEVYLTGIPFHIRNQRLDLEIGGKMKPYFFNYSLTPLFDEYGKVYGVMNTGADITDLNLAKQKLEESEIRYRTLIEETTVATALYTGPQIEIQFANDTMLKYWGKDKSIIGKTFRQALPELESQPFPALIEAVYTTGETYIGKEEKATLLINGKLQPSYYNYTYKALRNANGTIYGIHHTAVDVTEQVFARQKVEESEQTIRNIVLKAPVAMCILRGPDYLVEIANERMIEFWGKTAAEVMHKPIFMGLPEASEQGFEQLLYDVYTTGEAFSGQEMLIHLPRAGKIENVYVNFVYEAYKEVDGTISSIIAVVSDVTAQVLARHKIEEVVAERTLELAAANRELTQSNSELEQFAYIASHDLQEPLRKVSTFSQMLENSLDSINEPSQRYLDKINAATSRMTTLIRDVLAYSQLSKEMISYTPVSLQEVLDDIKSDFELLMQQKEATIQSFNLPTIEAIPLQMFQLFGNLVSNSLKFSRPDVKPEIIITATPVPESALAEYNLAGGINYCRIEFRDNGIGFDPQYAEHIFNIFQRLHAKSQYAGTGIGLAMCKKIAQNHRGYIYAHSPDNEGASFTIILPEKQVS